MKVSIALLLFLVLAAPHNHTHSANHKIYTGTEQIHRSGTKFAVEKKICSALELVETEAQK